MWVLQEKNHIKLFKKMPCKHGKKIPHFMTKLFQIKITKKIPVNKLKNSLILVTIQKN